MELTIGDGEYTELSAKHSVRTRRFVGAITTTKDFVVVLFPFIGADEDNLLSVLRDVQEANNFDALKKAQQDVSLRNSILDEIGQLVARLEKNRAHKTKEGL